MPLVTFLNFSGVKVEVDPGSIFDVQVKRLHEYKRQHLNALHILHQYLWIKQNPNAPFYPKSGQVEGVEHVVPDDLGMEGGNAVDAVAAGDAEVGHPHLAHVEDGHFADLALRDLLVPQLLPASTR